MTFCTYITSHPAGYYYIGKAMMARIKQGYKGSGKKLHSYFKKYPKNQWSTSILAVFDTPQEAYADEGVRVTVQTLKDPLCLNLIPGGTGVPMWKHNEQTKAVIKKFAIENQASLQYRAVMSASVRAALNTPEVKAKLVAGQRWQKTDTEKVKARAESARQTFATLEYFEKASKAQKKAAASGEAREKKRKAGAASMANQPIVQCPTCHRSGKSPLMKRWHFQNCKWGNK